MTIEEAIENLADGKLYGWCCCEVPYNDCQDKVNCHKAFDMAIAALCAQRSANDRQIKKALRDNGFETFEQLLEAYQQIRSEQKTPCDVCAYNPPSSCDRKPCCACPAMSKVE